MDSHRSTTACSRTISSTISLASSCLWGAAWSPFLPLFLALLSPRFFQTAVKRSFTTRERGGRCRSRQHSRGASSRRSRAVLWETSSSLAELLFYRLSKPQRYWPDDVAHNRGSESTTHVVCVLAAAVGVLPVGPTSRLALDDGAPSSYPEVGSPPTGSSNQQAAWIAQLSECYRQGSPTNAC